MLLSSLLPLLIGAWSAFAHPAQIPLLHHDNSTISTSLFMELEELARIVDISYCVGMTGLGIYKPFQCISRCSEFPDFELVKAWNTGPLLSDSCGYIALSHPPSPKRIIVAFRGTYSIANTIADLSTVPQQYVPYPGDDGGDEDPKISIFKDIVNSLGDVSDEVPLVTPRKCDNCTVHMGFHTSWLNTRTEVLPDLFEALKEHPDYTLTFVGHSLGGAVATLGALDLKARGWDPVVTTFGEPRLGNEQLMHYIDATFDLSSGNQSTITPDSKLRRVTHASDPIPLLPIEEWGYHMHAGEIFIENPDLPPEAEHIRHCRGDDDHNCIAGSDDISPDEEDQTPSDVDLEAFGDVGAFFEERMIKGLNSHWWRVPTRYKLWQLFFAHRDYFWRLGLCVPGGDPKDWYRKYPHYGDGDEL